MRVSFTLPTSIRVLIVFGLTLLFGVYFYIVAPIFLVKSGQDVTRANRVLYSLFVVLFLPFLEFTFFVLRKYNVLNRIYRRWNNYLLEYPKINQWLLIVSFVIIAIALLGSCIYSWFMGFHTMAWLSFFLVLVFYSFVDRIIINRTKYKDSIKKEVFLKKFVRKAMDDRRVETQLWDFKETLDIWHIKEKTAKQKRSVKFCELVAGFANMRGGILIVGITDKPPRKIADISDLENKLKETRETLDRYIEPRTDFIHLQPLILNNDEGKNASCLIITIAQTKDVIAVKDEQGWYSHPKRLETGLGRDNYENIHKTKKNVLVDNFDFGHELEQFVNDK